MIIAFAIWGSYTKRSTVQGQLIPQSGLIQVYTTQSGTILKKNVYEGQSVKTGDILLPFQQKVMVNKVVLLML